jgi:2-oxoisovalerate dehydrogenase E1 component beta subunit
VMMTPVGSGIHGSIYHSHAFDGQATRTPGWKIVIPSNPRDAYGLMLSAIADPNPVMYLAPKALLRQKALPGEEIPGEPGDERTLNKMIDAPLGDRSQWRPQWPDTEDFFVPLGKARIARPGTQLTVLTYARMLPLCVRVADELAEDGLSVEVIDLRSLCPLDWDTIRTSVQKTNRLLCVNEDTEVTNFGEHLIRRAVEDLFYELHAPPRLLAGAQLPGIGLADNLEIASVPQKDSIAAAMRALIAHEP